MAAEDRNRAAGYARAVNDPQSPPSADGLTHVDARGRAHMVDVSAKAPTARRAIAHAELRLDASTRELLFAGLLPKGDEAGAAPSTARWLLHERADAPQWSSLSPTYVERFRICVPGQVFAVRERVAGTGR